MGTDFASGYTIDRSSEIHYAVFLVTQEQIESLKVGVDKVVINTIPEVYERSKWSGKKTFGSSLYHDFINIKDEFTEETNGSNQ